VPAGCDDRCHPAKLAAIARHLATLDSDPERLFLCHDLDILDGADGPAIASGWFEVINQPRFGPHLHLNAAHHFFPFAVTSGMVYGRALLQRVMDHVPVWEWRMGTDGILGHAAMILCGEVHYLPQRLGSCVVHGGNNVASIEHGRFRAKPIWQDRWPRKLRFLDLLVDAEPFSEHERAERQGYIGRLAHVVRADPASRRYPQPLLSFIVDAQGAPPAWTQETAEAIAAQRDARAEAVWVGDAAVRRMVSLASRGQGRHRVLASALQRGQAAQQPAILDPDGVQAATPSRPATRRLLGTTVSDFPSRSVRCSKRLSLIRRHVRLIALPVAPIAVVEIAEHSEPHGDCGSAPK
jgi:hypothetical protein